MAINTGTINGAITSQGNLNGGIASNANLNGSASPAIFNYHPSLNGRELANQHPISAVTDLTQELNERPSEVISDEEIWLLD